MTSAFASHLWRNWQGKIKSHAPSLTWCGSSKEAGQFYECLHFPVWIENAMALQQNAKMSFLKERSGDATKSKWDFQQQKRRKGWANSLFSFFGNLIIKLETESHIRCIIYLCLFLLYGIVLFWIQKLEWYACMYKENPFSPFVFIIRFMFHLGFPH